jgi:hypothetical protein
MTHQEVELRKSLEILMDELRADDDFRDAFVRRPRKTLRTAGDWCVALTDSELYSLMAAEQHVYEQVVRSFYGEFLAAA